MTNAWRIIRRIIFLLVTIIIASNTIAYVVINNAYVHDWMRREINTRFLNKFGVSINLGTIYLNFVESRLTINEITLSKVGASNQTVASISQLTWGFYPWNPLSWLPKARYLAVEGWNIDLVVLDILSAQSSQTQDGKFDLQSTLQSVRQYLGDQVEFKNGLMSRSDSNQLTTSLKISDLFLKYDSAEKKSGISVVLKVDSSKVCFEKSGICQSPIPIDNASLNLSIAENRNMRVETLDVRGLYGNWNVSGDLVFTDAFKIQDYKFRVQGDADAGVWFRLGEMEGRGKLNANLNIEPLKKINEKRYGLEPSVVGKVSWNNVNLSGFDIYSGSADVSYSEQTIRYQNADIFTPAGARIQANGEFSLKERMPYANQAKFTKISFTELMAGLDAPTDVINFLMTTDILKVGGEINPEPERGFTLLIEGPVKATALAVPEFAEHKRHLPDCLVQLRLESDEHRMTFKGSSLTCDSDDETAEFELQKGLLDYDAQRQEFKFTGSSIPASIVSYFVDKDVSGSMEMNASIIGSAAQGVIFNAQVQVNDAQIFELDVPRLSGIVEIDQNNLRVRDMEGWLEDDRQSPNLVLRQFRLGFSTNAIEIDGKVEGSASDLLSVVGENGGDLSGRVSGDAELSKIRIKGNYKNILNSVIDAKIRLKDFAFDQVHLRDLQASFMCNSGWCTGSRVFAQDLSLGQAKVNSNRKSNTRFSNIPYSKAIFEIDSLSEKGISVRSDIQSVPFRFDRRDGSVVSGKMDLRGGLQGGRSDWEGSVSARMDELTVAGQPLGSVVATASSHGGGPLNVVVSGIFDQAQARFVFDHSLKKTSEMFLSIRNFDPFKYLPSINQSTLRLSSSLTAEMSVDGPGLIALLHSGRDFVTQISGHGLMRQARVQFGSDGFTLTEPMKLLLEEETLSFSPLLLKGSLGEVRSSGSYSFADSRFNARIEGGLDAATITNFTSFVSQSAGQISIRGNLISDADGFRFRGESKLENVFFSGRYLSPPLTAVNGRLVFQDSRIEIPQMTATKGNGQVDLVGSIDLQPNGTENEEEQSPALALRANIRSAQFRWPQDIFETAETTVDGQVELVGRGRPYLLNGDLRVAKGRAYRDATCQELLRVSSASGGVEPSIAKGIKPLVQLNLALEADNNISLQTTCIRGRLSSSLKITGTEMEPIVSGQLRLDNGQLTLLKTRFEVTRADAFFDNLVQIEPRLEAQMVAKIERYNVFVGAEGPLSRPRLNLWSDPSVGPDGTPLSRQALIRMISTNRGPGETTQTAVTQALANGVVGFFDDPLSQAVSRITRGFVDRFELQPILDSGQSSWRARVSRDLGEKFNLGLDIESNSQSLTGEIFINESVNVLGGFDRRSTQIGTYSELKGGFRFQFGGN